VEPYERQVPLAQLFSGLPDGGCGGALVVGQQYSIEPVNLMRGWRCQLVGDVVERVGNTS
jgi:hypothetical protein